ncbi:MAG: hypothetical protein OXU37_04495 [Thaumarchaeota archaeon]|nr:hypothetical protein [Nitrososphaerota archaeon]
MGARLGAQAGRQAAAAACAATPGPMTAFVHTRLSASPMARLHWLCLVRLPVRPHCPSGLFSSRACALCAFSHTSSVVAGSQ